MFSTMQKALCVVGVVGLMAATAGPALAQKAAPTAPASVVSATFSNPNGQQNFGTVACPTGTTFRTGGGVFGSLGFFAAGQQAVNSSYPIGPLTWGAFMNNDTGHNGTFTVYVICLRVS